MGMGEGDLHGVRVRAIRERGQGGGQQKAAACSEGGGGVEGGKKTQPKGTLSVRSEVLRHSSHET